VIPGEQPSRPLRNIQKGPAEMSIESRQRNPLAMSKFGEQGVINGDAGVDPVALCKTDLPFVRSTGLSVWKPAGFAYRDMP